jgi:hypothetical protein
MLKILKIGYWIVNIAIITRLLAIHFIIKERNYTDSINFYKYPLPVIIAVILGLSIFLYKRKYNVILAGILLVIWLGRSFKIHIPETVDGTDLEIVFWNASRDNGLEGAFSENEGIPDILVLVESKPNNIENFKAKYPSYYLYKSQREMYVFSKTPLHIESQHTSPYNSTVIQFQTRNIHFYAVDVTGSMDVPREWELGFVNKLLSTNQRAVILGDFNLPYESKHLKRLKTNFNHAFNKKGNGFRETWFWNLPLLSLDHIWVSKDLKILKTKKIHTFKSDHAMLKTYIRP